jgi:ankyrin repeat protein
MRAVSASTALLALAAVLMGCNVSLSPSSVTTLSPEDSTSTVMKEQNYQAVTQAIAQRHDITPYLAQQPGLAKKTFGGKTLLFDAAFFGNKDAAKALLDHGADVNYRTQLGMTALDSAVASKSQDVIALLKQRGGMPGAQR